METLNTYYAGYESLALFVRNNREVLLANQNHTVLVQVFSGICDKDMLLAISEQIRELVPSSQVIGTTTNGEIMNGMVSGLKTTISFSVFHSSEIRIACIEKKEISDHDLGYLLANKMSGEQTRVLILFSTGLAINATQLLKGIQAANPSLPVAGGNAGDNLSNTQCFVFANGQITDCGVAGAFLSGDKLNVTRHSHLGWLTIGKEMTITKSEGSRVYTIDNLPAYQVYRHYLGADDEFDILNCVEFPLAITKNELVVSRSPFLRHDDDSLSFFGDIDQGEKVRFSFGNIKMIVEQVDSLLEIIQHQPVESIFVYSCAARRSLLNETCEIETLPLQRLAPTTGFFTSGEFFHSDNTNEFLNNTMTILALSEGNYVKPESPKDSGNYLAETVGFLSNSEDNVTNRASGILKALTCLVRVVTSELNERTAELEMANEQLKYNSSHDTLTGLRNRNYFEQQLLCMEPGAVGTIMCDVDGLKMINDSFGHNMGDTILRATASILKSSANSGDLVARIGGDEFAILKPNSTQITTEDYCQRIRNAVSKYNQENPIVPLSISIGFSYPEDGISDVSTLLKTADDKMYREKLHRYHSIHSDLVHTLMSTLEARQIVNHVNNEQIQDLLITFAVHYGTPQNKLADLRLLAQCRDIGKVGISDQVLFSPDVLTDEATKEMQRHCEIGQRIARSSVDLLPIADWILAHHEWWNGGGYPLGLQGTDIPLECRLLAIVEAYDKMLADRPYRKAMNIPEALAQIRQCSGTQFDPALVDAFIQLIGKGDSREI